MCPHIFVLRNVYANFRHGRKDEDNIKIGLEKIWCEGVNWMELAHDCVYLQAVVNTVIHL